MNNMAPKTIAGYEILGVIGRGSTAQVVRARRDGKDYAIKIFDRFTKSLNFKGHEQEFCLQKQLNHPAIVRVYDYGTMDDFSYIVMDLVIGLDMAKMVQQRGNLAPESVIKIVKELASAMEYAKGIGVIHGDIKPSNIIVTEEGSARLVDFGLARIVPSWEETPVSHHESTSLGTTDFMAPEVLNDGAATWSSDLYSLGVVAYFGLCARLPSDGRTIFTRANNRIEGKLVMLSTRNPLVSLAVESAIHKALSPNPKNRYRSPEKFYAALISEDERPQLEMKDGPQEVKAQKKSDNRLDLYRYIVIPIVIAVIGAIAGIGKLLLG